MRLYIVGLLFIAVCVNINLLSRCHVPIKSSPEIQQQALNYDSKDNHGGIISHHKLLMDPYVQE